MTNINWIVRIKNKNFWLTIIPALLLLVQVVAALFGFTLDLGDLGALSGDGCEGFSFAHKPLVEGQDEQPHRQHNHGQNIAVPLVHAV